MSIGKKSGLVVDINRGFVSGSDYVNLHIPEYSTFLEKNSEEAQEIVNILVDLIHTVCPGENPIAELERHVYSLESEVDSFAGQLAHGENK